MNQERSRSVHHRFAEFVCKESWSQLLVFCSGAGFVPLRTTGPKDDKVLLSGDGVNALFGDLTMQFEVK